MKVTTKGTKTFIITDWTGGRIFNDKVFTGYYDAWEYIYKNVDNSKFDKTQNDNDDNYQEYFVVPE